MATSIFTRLHGIVSSLTVARVAVYLVTWMVDGDCHLDAVPIFRVGVLMDNRLAAVAKAGDVVDRRHNGPPWLDGSFNWV
jgi:hypothetical protein